MKQDMRSWRARFQCVSSVETRVGPLVSTDSSGTSVMRNTLVGSHPGGLAGEIRDAQFESYPATYTDRKNLPVVTRLDKFGKAVNT